MKIGIIGGTFDPIHNGHLMLGECAYRQYGLDQIWFMPNGNPPHKSAADIASKKNHRTEMVKLAIRHIPYFKLELYEIERTQVNYSYLTMEHFQELYSQDQFYFIIGADSLFSLETWAHPERLTRTCTILAACRDHMGTEKVNAQIRKLQQMYGGDIRLLTTPGVFISSSEIRSMLRKGISAKEVVPEPVLRYIEENGLYKMTFAQLKEKIRSSLKEDRYEHTLGVMYTAGALAMCHRADLEKAMTAGLLHDIAKCISTENKFALCRKYSIPITETEEKNPGLLHAKLGACLAEKLYGISDREILDSIAFHTTGRPAMTLLDKIIYIADYIEPNRNKAPHLEEIRHLAFTNLDQCLYEILEDSLNFLNTRDAVIDPMTERTYLYYKKEAAIWNNQD